MDGKWVGVNRPLNYFYLEASPDLIIFAQLPDGHGLLSLVIEKGPHITCSRS